MLVRVDNIQSKLSKSTGIQKVFIEEIILIISMHIENVKFIRSITHISFWLCTETLYLHTYVQCINMLLMFTFIYTCILSNPDQLNALIN